MSKKRAKLDLWMKDAAPSDDLRQWFNQEPDKWKEFQKRFQIELDAKPNLLGRIEQLEKERGTITLVYSARDTKHNNAVALMLAVEKTAPVN